MKLFPLWLAVMFGVFAGVVASELDLQRNCERHGVAKTLFTDEIKCEVLK